jgi:hypothetical protein
MVGPVPVTTMPVSFRKKRARHEQHPFPPSLRLRFTFPFAEPQAEATKAKGRQVFPSVHI